MLNCDVHIVIYIEKNAKMLHWKKCKNEWM